MLHRLGIACMAIALFAGLSATGAKADTTTDTFDFTISGNTYVWTATVPPVIANIVPNESFELADSSYTFNGTPTSATFIQFYTNALKGGFLLQGGLGPTLDTTGPSLFGDTSTSAPVFTVPTGPVDYTDLLTGAVGTLTVTETTVTDTPEPGTLLLTGIGVLALFWVARKQNRFSLSA